MFRIELPKSVHEKKSRAEAHPLVFYSARYSCINSNATDAIIQSKANTKLLVSTHGITRIPKAKAPVAVNFFI